MTPGVRPLVAGNWKMNGLTASLQEVKAMRDGGRHRRGGRGRARGLPAGDAARRTPAAILEGGPVALGAQDCHPQPSGAFTGDISAEMIKDAGAAYVIVGHSERRAGHGESDALVRAKAEAARRAGLTAIVCVGETRAEREAGRAIEIVSGQLRGSLPPGATPENLVVAYEPVWAIGTGLTPTPPPTSPRCMRAIRGCSASFSARRAGKMRILYGGSVKPANARELLGLANVDGALVGGASLKAADFLGIAAAYL